MTDPHASDQDVSRVIRSWLHEDRHEDASRVAGAVLDTVDATQRRRTTWWPARRTPLMSKFVSLGLGAAVVVVAVVIGNQVLVPAPAPGGVGSAPSAVPSPTPAPTATREPSPSLVSAPPLTETFTSMRHGISLSYPEGWTAEEATEPWTGGPSDHSIVDPYDDRLLHPTLTDHLFLSIASQPIGDATPEDWTAEQMAEWERCTPTEPIAVDGAAGLIGSEGCHLAVVTTDGRGYWISLRASQDDPSAVAPYDGAWFREVLATVQLRPEDAVD
jgi:hypothetical protein